MEQKIKDIARRIRELREILGISAAEMSEVTSVSVDEYKALENGETDFSFTFIYKCAKKFGVEVTDLLSGVSPTLSSYSVVRKGEGTPLARRKGFSYQSIAPLFRKKLAEPFLVKAPYNEAEQDKPIKLSTHKGQEFDIVVSGSLKVCIDGNIEILNEGDTIYYDSATPHGMIAVGGKECVFYAIVINADSSDYKQLEEPDVIEFTKPFEHHTLTGAVYEKFVDSTLDDSGVLKDIRFKNTNTFNFGFDVLDVLAEKVPNKVAMLHIANDMTERRFTFAEIKKYSNMTANYFKSLGIGKGDKVMLVLKRHYQFWFSILALHKLGAVAIPATNQLVKKDFEYRFNAAEVSAVICTADGDTAHQIDLSLDESPTLKTRVIVGGKREGWSSFDEQLDCFSDKFDRPADAACGEDLMLMFFTSGTTGYPKIAMHSHTYPLGHFITSEFWHNVDPDGIHFTISDTGWGKALWGKLYGQWLSEGAVFVYDFDKFIAHDILSMFKKYNITTFCAPPTMYRFFIKEDLSKYDLSSLKYATTAGEALNPEVFNQFKKATGLVIMEGFGQTETTLTICNLVGTTPRIGSMGRPSPMYNVDLVDANDKAVALGETGEIVIRTDKSKPCGLFLGYYKDEEKTKEAWHDDVYHTGDTAWRDEDGYLWYVGRTDDLIKSSGYRIGPFEIENVIMELPYVLECAITGVPDEIRGQVVKATIVLTRGTEASEELKKEIQEYVKNNTAPYKYPRIVEFASELPKTISGKIRRVELREKHEKTAE